MVRRREQLAEPFDGIGMLQRCRGVRGGSGRGADRTDQRGFATGWKKHGADVLAWAQDFDERHGLPPDDRGHAHR
jgi:hypothetical protein